MTTPEFCRLVPLARIGVNGFRQAIAATPAERAALCRRFDLVTLERLTAEIELDRQGGAILLRAAFGAVFEQSCVVTLEPVPGTLSESFALRYGPPDADACDDAVDDTETFEPLAGDTIDVGEAVAQEFALALPAFPRHPDADAAADDEPGPVPPGS